MPCDNPNCDCNNGHGHGGGGAGFALGIAVGAAAASFLASGSGAASRKKAKQKFDKLIGGTASEELVESIKEVAAGVLDDIAGPEQPKPRKKPAKRTKRAKK